MNFEMAASLLKSAGSNMAEVLKSKTTIPILSGILIELNANGLFFTASDGHDTLMQRIAVDEVNVNEIGKVVVPQNFFSSIARLNGNVELDLEGDVLHVKAGRTKLNFSTFNADEYPLFQQDKPIATYHFSGADFARMVNSTIYATATSEIRPVLQSVHGRISSDVQMFYATDSHRLSKFVLNKTMPLVEDEVALNIPAKALKFALKKFNVESDVFLMNFPTKICMANGNLMYYTTLLEGKYPDVERLLPQEFKRNFLLNRDEFYNALFLLSEVSANSVVTLTLDGGLFAKLEGSDSIAAGESELAVANYQGEVGNYSISFSCKYMLDVLKVCTAAEVCIQLNQPMNPFVITHGDGEKHLILPIRQY